MSVSIIVCATKPDLVEELRENIARTIGDGCEYEIIAIDNTRNPRPLAAVYNEGGRKARFDNLLFIHQDAGFITENWLLPIEKKLSEPDCGVIGFAGTKVMYDFPGSWGAGGLEWTATNYDDGGKLYRRICLKEEDFTEVAALDGFALFVRKSVWEQSPFDEENLTGFHCYDVDFSLSLFPRFKNYVCFSVLPYHHSPGNFDTNWAKQTMRLYDRKWRNILPCITPDVPLSEERARYLEERMCFKMLKEMNKIGFNDPVLTKRFLSFPMTARHFEHLLKFLSYKIKGAFGKGVK